MPRSGLRKRLKYQTPQNKFSTPKSTPVASISQQKKEQVEVREKSNMAESIAAYGQCCETARGKIDRIRAAIAAANLDHTKFSIHALRTYLKTVDDEYNEYQNKIYLTDPSKKAEFEPQFVSFEELYEFVRIGVCQMIEEHEESKTAIQLAATQAAVGQAPAQQDQPSGSGGGTALQFAPTIVLQQSALPSFDGKYENWFKFQQMFRDIADKCITDSAATKLHYLDKALVGKAYGAIDPQIIRDNDYEGAWRSLTEQFENLPVLINDTISKLLNLKAMANESYQQLKRLVDDVEKCISSLEFHNLKLDDLSEAIMINLISSKLDTDTRKVWESNVKRKQLPKYKQLISVLRNQQHVLERCENAKPTQKTRSMQPASRTTQTATSKAHTSVIQKNESCPICEEKHSVEKCDSFKRSDIKERYERAKQHGLCFGCLKKGHRTSECSAKVKCPKCSKRHNVMLHPEEKRVPEKAEPPVAPMKTDEAPKEKVPTTVAKCILPCRAADYPAQVLLATAVVYNGIRTSVKFQVHLKARSRVSEDEFCLDYLVVPRVTGTLPARKEDIDSWSIPPGIIFADPTFFETSRIDMLVGAKAFSTYCSQVRSNFPMNFLCFNKACSVGLCLAAWRTRQQWRQFVLAKR